MKRKWKLFVWDWKEQAPINSICVAINDMAPAESFGIETGSDEYAVVVAPKDTPLKQVQEAYDNYYRNGDESQIERSES